MIIRRLSLMLIVIILILGSSIVVASPGTPSVSGPEIGTSGEYLTYKVINPASQPLSILSSTGIWVRDITVTKQSTTCSLDDGGTEDVVTCNGDFRLTVSSDLGQQIVLQLAQASVTVSISGDHPVQDTSLVHIYNGITPSIQSVGQSGSNPPATTNVLVGEHTKYRLAALNFSSDITRTFDIILTVPPSIHVTAPPQYCVLQLSGSYSCSFTVAPGGWHTSDFEVKWTSIGVKALKAVGTVDGIPVGEDMRLGNVIAIYSNQLFVPVAKR